MKGSAKFIIFLIWNLYFYSNIFSQLRNACKLNQFRCVDGSKCLRIEQLCNEKKDCSFGEDEGIGRLINCSNLSPNYICSSEEFKCRFGGCIPRSQVCDSIPHCKGSSDEAFDFCRIYQRRITTTATTAATTKRIILTTTTKRPTSLSTTVKILSTLSTRRFITTSERSTTTTPTTTQRIIIREKISEDIEEIPRPIIIRGKLYCPPIEKIPEGQRVICYNKKYSQNIHCDGSIPEGTTAEFSCLPFWTHPATQSRRTLKICKKGFWKGNRKFTCFLDCGEGGHRPIGFLSGAQSSLKGKWPWNVGIYETDPKSSSNYTHICGGTLITQKVILSAAHCVIQPQSNNPRELNTLGIFFGKFNRTFGNDDQDVQNILPSKIQIHPDFNYANLHSDIALIWLEKEVKISPYVHPVCLPSSNEHLWDPGTLGVTVGWGSIGEGLFPEELKEAFIPIVGSNTCRKKHPSLNSLVSSSTFCAGFGNGTSVCNGDSGAGLIFNEGLDSKWTIWGIVSGGVQSEAGKGLPSGCDTNYYAVFTNVVKFRKWIDRKIDMDTF